jgi:hypothetical protein
MEERTGVADDGPIPAPAPGPPPFEGTPWELVAYRDAGGALTPAGARPWRPPVTTFVAGRWHGSAGCNLLGGRYTRRGADLRVEPGGSTAMACSTRLMLQEGAYAAALQRVVRFAVAGAELSLVDAAGEPVLRFRVLAPLPLVGTPWRVGFYDAGASLTSGPLQTVRTATFGADGRVTGISGRITYVAAFTTRGGAEDGTIHISPPTTTLTPIRAPRPLTPADIERRAVRDSLAWRRDDTPSGTLSPAEEQEATREVRAALRAALATAPASEAPPPPSDAEEQAVARAYLAALEGAVAYRILGRDLTLLRPDGYAAAQLVAAVLPEGDE